MNGSYPKSSNGLFDENDKVIPKSQLFKNMIYSNLVIAVILFGIGIIFSMVDTNIGFAFIILGFAFSLPVIGLFKYDFISVVTFFLVNIIIAILTFFAVTITPLVLIYYVVFGLTIYTFMVDKQARSSVKSNFNKDLFKFYILIIAQYAYLLIASLINIESISNRGYSDFLIYYFLIFIITVNLIFLHLLKYNARLFMFFTSLVFVIYSIIELQASILSVFAIAINLLTWIILLFDKDSLKYFKRKDTGEYFLFRSIIILNVFSAFILGMGFLYLYSIEENLAIILVGGILVSFYAFAIFKVEIRSLIWKHIFTVFLLLIGAVAVILFETYASYAILIIPIAIFTIFTLNFDYTTVNRFKKLPKNTTSQLS